MFRRSIHKARVRTIFCAALYSLLFSARTDGCRVAGDDSGTSDRATMIVLAPVGPVFVDLRLTVSRLPYREWVARFLANEMDVDQSTRLDETELNLLTDRMKTLINVKTSAEILSALNAVNSDVSVDDFVSWLQNRIPRAFDLIAQPQPADNAVRIASLLDTDYDGSISETELQEGSRTLRFRDLDNDETFSISELLPYRDPRSQNAAVAPDAVNLPFFHVIDRESALRAAERIVQHYGNSGQLPGALLRQTPETVSTEGRSSRDLSIAEVSEITAMPEFHMRMDVSLSVKANTSSIKVVIDPHASSFCVPNAEQTFGAYRLVIDGLPLTVNALGGSANDRRNTRGFLGQTFSMADGDKNQYLDETEFNGMLSAFTSAGIQASFPAVDHDRDSMITRSEIFAFAKRDQLATASRVEVSVKQDGKTLYSLLDANSDRRLSRREMNVGGELLKKFDTNQDGKFADTELGTEFVLAISLGRPDFRRNSGQSGSMAMQMTSGDAVLPSSESMRGPTWFRSMDRNQDGDVSPREFLGTTAHFARIDANLDNLISAEEAAAIQQ